jgi:putative sigma-54 modulation protein
MRLELTGRHVDITPALRRLVDKKLVRLNRLLNDSALSAHVVLTREKRARRADITLHARGEKVLHGEGDMPTWEASMTQAIDRIAQQGQKVKGKWEEWKRRGKRVTAGGGEAGAAAPPAAPRVPPARPRMPRILRSARLPIRPMTVADAAREVDANGEGLVIFRNLETAAIAVVFRRGNGELTLIETE